MQRTQPTSMDATVAKVVLSQSGIKARVRRFDWSLRVCLQEGASADERAAAESVLADAGLRGVCGGALVWEGGYQAFAYKVS